MMKHYYLIIKSYEITAPKLRRPSCRYMIFDSYAKIADVLMKRTFIKYNLNLNDSCFLCVYLRINCAILEGGCGGWDIYISKCIYKRKYF